ncbi:hypothetical protein QYF61_019781 [Mycteria americana]|uniref:Uncharacterized protein n=1 Tax=Mycteria americana TaxID=33587 RepID=A0AAN7N9D6_MYCAM|nr:hypothetical protein QYF61_019781 [Mycteria americana]
MRKDFGRRPGEHVVTWLLRCWDNRASSLELEDHPLLQSSPSTVHLSHFNLSSLIHLLVVFMFLSGLTLGYMSIYATYFYNQLEYSRPQILCIPDSKILGVDLESPLVLSARGSSRRISSWMAIRESRLVQYCRLCTVVVATGTCCSLTLSNPITEGSSERPGKVSIANELAHDGGAFRTNFRHMGLVHWTSSGSMGDRTSFRLLAPLSQHRSSQVAMCSPGRWLKSFRISCSSLRDRDRSCSVKLQPQCLSQGESEQPQCLSQGGLEQPQCLSQGESEQPQCLSQGGLEQPQCLSQGGLEQPQCLSQGESEQPQCLSQGGLEQPQCLSQGGLEQPQCLSFCHQILEGKTSPIKAEHNKLQKPTPILNMYSKEMSMVQIR